MAEKKNEIEIWLQEIGLKQYAELFAKQEYFTLQDLQQDPPLNEELEKWGITAGRDRHRILNALKEPQKQDSHKRKREEEEFFPEKIPNYMNFSVNSVIFRNRNHFFVAREALLKRLVNMVFPDKLNTELFFVIGPRESGKSTLMMDFVTYCCLPAGIECLIVLLDTLDKCNIWTYMYTQLSSQNRFKNKLGKIWEKCEDFELFSNGYHKPCILIIDEMNNVIGHPDLESFLSSLRKLRNTADIGNTRNLKAIIGIGVFSLVNMNTTNVNLSPWNVKEALYIPFFDLRESKELFIEYSKNSGVKIDPTFVEFLYYHTSGYPGIFCCCGRAVQIYITEHRLTSYSCETWDIMKLENRFFDALSSFSTTSRILNTYTNIKDPTIAEAAKLFIKKTLSTETVFTLDPQTKVCIMLARDGLIAPASVNEVVPDHWKICCPLMKAYFGYFISNGLHQNIAMVPIPIDNNKILLPSLLENLLKCLNTDRLTDAYVYATKASEVPKSLNKRKKVLKESAYSMNIGALISNWFPSVVLILPEANCEGQEAVDYLLNYNDNVLLIDFAANIRYGPEDRANSFLGHLKRVKKYAEYLRKQHPTENTSYCLINFMGVDTMPLSLETLEKLYPSPPTAESPNIHVYVLHTHDFSRMDAYIWSSASPVQVKKIA